MHGAAGHLKTEHTESLYLLRRHLGSWPRSKHEKRTWTVAAADGLRCTRVRWEINFLLTFETAPFFFVYPTYCAMLFWIINWSDLCLHAYSYKNMGMRLLRWFRWGELVLPVGPRSLFFVLICFCNTIWLTESKKQILLKVICSCHIYKPLKLNRFLYVVSEVSNIIRNFIFVLPLSADVPSCPT